MLSQKTHNLRRASQMEEFQSHLPKTPEDRDELSDIPISIETQVHRNCGVCSSSREGKVRSDLSLLLHILSQDPELLFSLDHNTPYLVFDHLFAALGHSIVSGCLAQSCGRAG